MSFHNQEEEKLFFRRAEQAFNRLSTRWITGSEPFVAELSVVDARPSFADKPVDGYRPVKEGEPWGSNWQTGWFHLRGVVPDAWKGREVVAWLEIAGEGLVYDRQGKALQGITHGSVFDRNVARPMLPLFKSCKGGEVVELWLEGAANHMSGIQPPPGPERPKQDPERYGDWPCKVNKLRLACVDPEVWALRWDMEILLCLYRNLPAGSIRRARILRALGECASVLARDETACAEARAALKDVLSKPAHASDLRVCAVGHAHIDTAWLWPLAEGVRKTARTYASQLKLIEDYPGYIFGASAARHYAWMKDHYPEMYARVKEAVRAGRWEVQGGMWVEADCNIPSGESLVRQFIHGKNFFRDEFGLDVDNLWLPDVFGYAASLPQIMEKCGVTTFLTQKISWSQFNEFPFNTFWWEGIDGSRVLTHFPPENTYNGDMRPWALIQAQERFKEKAELDEMMSLFGIGDGGGGPLPEHLELGQRLANLEGCPPVRFGMARDFFAGLRKSGHRLETWVGELYLELHRGTLTTQALVKKHNRRLEQRLREIEMLWASAPLEQYPCAELDAIWKETLTLQFHDIIPGSSINKVYQETHRNYEDLLARCDQLVERFAGAQLPVERGAVTLFNSRSEPFTGAVTLPASFDGQGAVSAPGLAVPTQMEDGGSVALVNIPAQSFLTLVPSGRAGAPQSVQERVLENELVRYTFSAEGLLLSAFDKRGGRERLKAPGNRLTLYHDRPVAWDAWDVDAFYRDEKIADAALEVEAVHAGPVRQSLYLKGRVAGSTITQRVTLNAGSARLDFYTTVDWRERHRMLRVAFPADVATDRAACEIQYGHLFRNTHGNTSWDMAKFEVCAHRWADLSTADGGLALLNDCKYGHCLLDNILDLNLLRSPTAPDPDADEGVHEFTYSLLPHPGDITTGEVQREARALNQPPVLFAGRGAPATGSPITLTGDGVDLAVLKRTEKGDGLVVRLVETRGLHSSAVLKADRSVALVSTDLLEWSDGPATDSRTEHPVALAPFEIRTYKLIF